MVQRRLSGPCLVDLVAEPGEDLGEDCSERRLVLDDKDARAPE